MYITERESLLILSNVIFCGEGEELSEREMVNCVLRPRDYPDLYY